MGKQLVRLYPIDINRMPWQQGEGLPDGIREKVLALDPASGSATRYLKIEPGAVLPSGTLDRWEETYVIEGTLVVGDNGYPPGSYLCRPAGADVPETRSEEGCLCIQVRDFDDALDKAQVQLMAEDIERMAWALTPSGHPGHTEKILTRSPSGSFTRLLLIDPGADTTVPDDHDHNEEVLILQGSCRNGEEFHPAGTYTFNPPHSIHGPFMIDELLLCFEVKNQS